jgi:hypothetical protein
VAYGARAAKHAATASPSKRKKSCLYYALTTNCCDNIKIDNAEKMATVDTKSKWRDQMVDNTQNKVHKEQTQAQENFWNNRAVFKMAHSG